MELRSGSHDLVVSGVPFRVPGSYMQPTAITGYVYDYLHFAFWVSDGKPIGEGVPRLGSEARVGRAVFWPPELGRPFFSSDDFVVLVLEARPMAERAALERQQRTRQLAVHSAGIDSIEDGLECRTYATGAKGCVTPRSVDPDVSMTLFAAPGNPWWEMYFYSRPDSLQVRLRFPQLGQMRWSTVVCRTLELVRSWRVADGPRPPDCSKSPHLL